MSFSVVIITFGCSSREGEKKRFKLWKFNPLINYFVTDHSSSTSSSTRIGNGFQETFVLFQEKLKRKPWARWKDKEKPHLLTTEICDNGIPKVSVFFLSERSSRSDSSSPKCINIKLPNESTICVVILCYVPEGCSQSYEHVNLIFELFLPQMLSVTS